MEEELFGIPMWHKSIGGLHTDDDIGEMRKMALKMVGKRVAVEQGPGFPHKVYEILSLFQINTRYTGDFQMQGMAIYKARLEH